MKKSLVFVVIIAIIAMATQESFAQTGIQITVHPQLFAGTLSGGITPLCYAEEVTEITGTPATGGQGSYTYQWQQSVNLGTTWTNIAGVTGLNYNPGSVTTTTWYRRNDTDPCGTVTTNIIQIDVYGQFLAGVTTGGNNNICEGNDGGTLTATASTGGAPGTTQQWQQWNNTLGVWENIAGETGLTYTVGNLIETSSFRIAYINPLCGTLYGNAITLNVYTIFAGGTVTGGNSPICYNTNAGILTGTAATGGAPGTTMQWEFSTDGATYTAITGQTTLNLVLGNLTQTMWYRLRYNNTCGTVYSNVTNIVVYNQFVVGSIAFVGTNPGCYNTDPGMFTGVAAAGGDPTTTYQWQTSTNGTTWTDIAGETGLNYDLPVMISPINYFRRMDTNGCGVLYTNNIQITIYPEFDPGLAGVAQSICSGTAPAQLTFLIPPSGGDGTYTYQWQQSADGGVADPYVNIPGATNSTFQPPSLTSGIWYQPTVTSGSGCGSLPAIP